MKTSTLQSLLKKGASQISKLELSIAQEKSLIGLHKTLRSHRDLWTWRYKRLGKFRKDLGRLAKTQKELKQEINLQYCHDNFFL